MQDALNRHINRESYASYLYLSMSSCCDPVDQPVFAHWMRIPGKEEYAHARNLFDFVQDRRGRVIPRPTKQPDVEFGSVLDVIESMLAHQREVRVLIN